MIINTFLLIAWSLNFGMGVYQIANGNPIDPVCYLVAVGCCVLHCIERYPLL